MRVHYPKLYNIVHTFSLECFYCFQRIKPLYSIHIKLALIGQTVSEEKTFEYYGNIHAYCPRVGTYELLGYIFVQNH